MNKTDVRRENIVPVRFSDAELDLVVKAATLELRNRAEFIRELVLAHSKRVLKRTAPGVERSGGDEVA